MEFLIQCPKCGSRKVYEVINETNAYRVEFYEEGYAELDFDDKIEFEVDADGFYCDECEHRFYYTKE